MRIYKEQESNLILPEHDDDDLYLLKKYIKCNIWGVAARPSCIWDARLLKVKEKGAVSQPMNFTLGFQFGGKIASLDFRQSKNSLVTVILKL